MTNDDRTAEAGRVSKLDRRREKAQSAKARADAAQQRVSALDGRLAAHAAQTQEHEAALRRAGDEVSRRKKALKASAKQARQLGVARKKAEASAAKARRQTDVAEDRYDKAVLAEMVRRERIRDLAAHDESAAGPARGAELPVGPVPKRRAFAANTPARKTAATSADPTEQKSDGPA
jgi:chromosome segregation ATPase